MTESTQRGIIVPSPGQMVANGVALLALLRQLGLSVDAAIGGLDAVANLSPEALQILANFDAEIDLSNAVIDARTRSGNRPVGQDEIVVNVKDHGAVGDDATDDTSAIQDAADHAASIKGHLYFPAVTTGYRTSDTVEFAGIDVTMEGTIRYNGPQDRPAIAYNPSGSVVSHRRITVRVDNVAHPPSWDDEDFIGVLFRNIQRCHVAVDLVNGFTIGACFLGDDAGNVYNIVELLHLMDNKIGLDLDSTGSGWTNENLFLGGNFSVSTTTNTDQDRIGIRIRSQASFLQDANMFKKPSIEIGHNLTGGAEAVPILISSGQANTFEDVRSESNGNLAMRTTGGSRDNFVSTSYAPLNAYIEDLGDYPNTVFRKHRSRATETFDRLLYGIPNLAERAGAVTAPVIGDSTMIPGLVCIASGSETVRYSITGVPYTSQYVEIPSSRCYGIYVDTRFVKRFLLVTGAVASDRGARTFVRCHDSSGTVINPATKTSPMVRGHSTKTFSTTANFGGGYITTESATATYIAVVDDDVESIIIGVTGGTQDARLTSFAVYVDSMDANAGSNGTSVWTTFPDFGGDLFGSGPPTTIGPSVAGRKIWNVAPATSSPMGWVCTAAGTPGTWVAMPNL